MLQIFQNIPLYSKPFLSAWFQIKHQKWMWRSCIFVSPHKESHLIWMYLSCDSGKLWVHSSVLENHHVIGINTKNALIFIKQILCKMDHRKTVMTTTCKQLSKFKALWCFILKIIQYDEIFFCSSWNTCLTLQEYFPQIPNLFYKLLKQNLADA